jgi:hypothetical protein
MIFTNSNANQSLLIRSAYMHSLLSNSSILLPSSLHENRWILNFLHYIHIYIWKEHYRITPFFQKSTLLAAQAMQRVFSNLSHFIVFTWELRDIMVSTYNRETFQIHTVYGILSELWHRYRFCKQYSYHHN